MFSVSDRKWVNEKQSIDGRGRYQVERASIRELDFKSRSLKGSPVVMMFLLMWPVGG